MSALPPFSFMEQNLGQVLSISADWKRGTIWCQTWWKHLQGVCRVYSYWASILHHTLVGWEGIFKQRDTSFYKYFYHYFGKVRTWKESSSSSSSSLGIRRIFQISCSPPLPCSPLASRRTRTKNRHISSARFKLTSCFSCLDQKMLNDVF